MTVVASVDETRRVRHGDTETPDVEFSGAQADNGAPQDCDRTARNEVQV